MERVNWARFLSYLTGKEMRQIVFHLLRIFGVWHMENTDPCTWTEKVGSKWDEAVPFICHSLTGNISIWLFGKRILGRKEGAQGMHIFWHQLITQHEIGNCHLFSCLAHDETLETCTSTVRTDLLHQIRAEFMRRDRKRPMPLGVLGLGTATTGPLWDGEDGLDGRWIGPLPWVCYRYYGRYRWASNRGRTCGLFPRSGLRTHPTPVFFFKAVQWSTPVYHEARRKAWHMELVFFPQKNIWNQYVIQYVVISLLARQTWHI
jgi:hypothetical protein